jgi:N-acetylmuramoyl-L-alanine amidase
LCTPRAVAYVDLARWRQEIAQPDWYLRLRPEYEAQLERARSSPRPLARAIADEVYGFFETALADGTLAVGDDGPDWDAERQPIDTAVIHHTNLPAGITRERIEAIHLTRIYARYYADPAPQDAEIRGTAIYSGHVRDRQVFYGYHWLVRKDGTAERLLEDGDTGWHAGDWGVNCRSVGICLDGSFAATPPSEEARAAVARLLTGAYPGVGSNVLGHFEVNRTTTCPGATFPVWRRELVEVLSS